MEPVPEIRTAWKVLILWLNVNRDTSVNKRMGSELKNWGSVSGTGTDFPTRCARTGLETAKSGRHQYLRKGEGYAENLLTNSSRTVGCPISPLFKFAVNWGPRYLF
jgi:hypothetical protein